MVNVRKNTTALILLITAGLFYFLIFPQFALLHRMEESNLHLHADKVVLTLMGLGGILGSWFPLWQSGKSCFIKQMQGAWLLCAIASLFAGQGMQAWHFYCAGLLSGLGLGVLTVSTVGLIRPCMQKRNACWVCGWGTGLAYFFANLPSLFEASAQVQCLSVLPACALGALALFLMDNLNYSQLHLLRTDPYYKHPRFECFPLWVFLFMAIIWMDSMAFTVIQQTPRLFNMSWGSPDKLWLNAGVHLIAALTAGKLLDMGKINSVLGFAVLMLVCGCWILDFDQSDFAYGHLFYVAGVSWYSVALIAVAALVSVSGSKRSVLMRAAWLYTLAGWIGSGVGVVDGLRRENIPFSTLLIAFAFLVMLLILSSGFQNKKPHKRIG